jgi:hypothetical protein
MFRSSFLQSPAGAYRRSQRTSSGDFEGARAYSRICEAGIRDAGLEQLDGIAGGILEQDLLPANPLNNVVAELNAALSEQLDPLGDVVDFKDESVPSPWFRLRAVRHCLSAAALTAWCAEDKP